MIARLQLHISQQEGEKQGQTAEPCQMATEEALPSLQTTTHYDKTIAKTLEKVPGTVSRVDETMMSTDRASN